MTAGMRERQLIQSCLFIMLAVMRVCQRCISNLQRVPAHSMLPTTLVIPGRSVCVIGGGGTGFGGRTCRACCHSGDVSCVCLVWCVCLQGAPKLKVAIVGGGLAGLSTAVELLDQG